MTRNYNNEKQWLKNKYVRFDCRLDSNEYGKVIGEVKEKIGTNEFLRRSLELYKKNPNLFCDEELNKIKK